LKRGLAPSQLRCDVALGTEPPAMGSGGQSPPSPDAIDL
jgi:hypothetical protein